MKRGIAIILIWILISLTLTACGKSSSSDAESKITAVDKAEKYSEANSNSNDTAVKDTTNRKDGYNYSITCMINWRDEFTSAMDDAMQRYCEENNIHYTIQDFQKDDSKLIQYIETAKTDGDDAVLILEQNTEAIPQCVKTAGDMAVVVINRAPDDTTIFKDKVAYVGSREREAGTWQGEYIAKVLKKKGETVCKPIYLLGTLGAENTTSRTDGSKAAIEEAGLKIEIVSELVANWDRAEAITKISPLLSTSDYNCIIANNDAMALGAVEAIQSAGLNPGSIPIVGIDGQADGCAAVEAGTLAMTVYQSASGQGIAAINAAVNLVEGNENIAEGTEYEVDAENPNMIWVPFEPVYQDNVADYE